MRTQAVLKSAACNRFRDGIHQADGARPIHSQNAFANAAKHRHDPLFIGLEPTLAVVFVERDLNGALQLLLAERFDNVTVWFGAFGPLDGRVVRERGDENHGDVEPRLNDLGSFDSVDPALQLDVHQDKIRAFLRGSLDGFFAGCKHGRY